MAPSIVGNDKLSERNFRVTERFIAETKLSKPGHWKYDYLLATTGKCTCHLKNNWFYGAGSWNPSRLQSVARRTYRNFRCLRIDIWSLLLSASDRWKDRDTENALWINRWSLWIDCRRITLPFLDSTLTYSLTLDPFLDKPMVLTITSRSRQTNLIALFSDIYDNPVKLSLGGQSSRPLLGNGRYYSFKCIRLNFSDNISPPSAQFSAGNS